MPKQKWCCDYCKTGYKEKMEAMCCEKSHEEFKLYLVSFEEPHLPPTSITYMRESDKYKLHYVPQERN
jgi:hypothetical protein